MRTGWQSVPEYREAAEWLNLLRDSAFILETETLCGVEVHALTARHFITLDIACSPFVRRGIPEPFDVILFLWIVSTKFRKSSWASWRFARTTGRRLRMDNPKNWARCVEEISQYMTEATMDARRGGSDDDSVAPYSWVAALVAGLASQFGWTEQSIVTMPLKRAYAYQRCIRAMTESKPLFTDPLLFKAKQEFRERQKREESQN